MPKTHRLESLPKWAQEHIWNLENDVLSERRAHAETRKAHALTADGREWFTLDFRFREHETIFTCDRSGTHPLFSMRRGDALMVGRKAKKAAGHE